ncbi:MAG: hypothetical protein AAJB65_00640 [Candidatus Hodgkinia cicadicola]
MYSCVYRVNQRVLILCGRHKRSVGRIVKVINKANVTKIIVCPEQLTWRKTSVGHIVVTASKLRKLELYFK